MKKLYFIAIVAVLGLTACGPSPEELVQQGKAYLENDNCEEAVKCFGKAVEKGNAEAMYEIGMMYYDGICIDKDQESAATWFKHAADIGYPDAQNKLAWMYWAGRGVEKNEEKAVKWAQLALGLGEYLGSHYWESYYVLGTCYVKGKVLSQDNKNGVKYLQKAADMNILVAPVADKILLPLYLEGEGVQDDEKAITACCGAILNSDRAVAMNHIGMMYYNGEGVDENMTKAFNWFKRAANAGNADAQWNLGILYYRGNGVTKNLNEGKYWLQKAADQGHKEAQETLKALGQAEKAKRDKEAAEKRAYEEKQKAAVQGIFSISSNRKIMFSRGNLQYQASTKTWRFAEHQWDVIGADNGNISPNYSGWIDLFGWGTGNCPTKSDKDNNYRWSGDWGDNIISNGGDKEWRTLTKDQWVYVCNQRSTSTGIRYVKAVVNGINGIILLPDNWSESYYKLSAANKSDVNYESNIISKDDWIKKFEKNGAVFLPAAGFRAFGQVMKLNHEGDYWSATFSHQNGAFGMSVTEIYQYADNWIPVFRGESVRLVTDL